MPLHNNIYTTWDQATSFPFSGLSWNNVGPCNANETRSACPTFTMGANIGSPGTAKNRASQQRPDTERMSSYRFRYTPASPCNATGTRSACPTATRVASFSPTKGQHKRGTCGNCNSIMAETKYKR